MDPGTEKQEEGDCLKVQVMRESEKTPLASIITATFNSEKTLSKTIESVLNQTYGNIEYIIADGASTDGTLKIAESYEALFKKKGYTYKIISGKDEGIYSGINKGIAQAHGIIVGNVNSDDYYEPEIVQTAMNCYRKQKYDLFYADVNIVDSNGALVKIKQARRMKGVITTRHWNHPTMFVPNRIYRKRKYDSSYKYYADCDYMLWLYRKSRRITVVNKPLSNFRLGGRSTRSDVKESLRRVNERYRCYRRNGYSPCYIMECLFMDMGKDVAMRVRKHMDGR